MVYLSPGNRRMKIPTFSLPAGITCPNATPTCLKWCYSKKAERAYKNVIPCRLKNFQDSKNDDFVYKMSELIKKKKCPYIRIHESGDFYSQEYLDKWIKICKKFPEKKFLAYTQSYHLDFNKTPNNLILYLTIWPDSQTPSNFAFKRTEMPLRAIIIGTASKYIGNIVKPLRMARNAFKCKKGKGSKITCDKCLYCFEGRGDVIFEVH